MKIKDFFPQTNQKTKIIGQTTTLKTGEAGKYRQTKSRSVTDRSSRQKIIKYIDYLNSTINQFDLSDI